MILKEPFIKKPHFLKFENDNNNITLGFSTRKNGYSAFPKDEFNLARYVQEDDQTSISKNQQVLADEIGFPTEQWVFPIQTHENKVVHVSKEDRGTNINALTEKLHGVDGMYTYDSDTLLTMCYADCVPVYFYSECNDFIGLAHAGWRGTYGQIVKEMLKHVDFDLKFLKVVIGPSTSNTYEINDDIKSKFETLTINSDDYIETRGDNRHGIDLKRANALLLEEEGVPKENISISQYATSENLSLFFSYRIEKSKTGRMLAFIGRH